MRILHFVHGYLPRHRGGTESYVAALVRAQRGAGHEVAVATGSEDGVERARFEKTREFGHLLYRVRRSGLHLDSWQKVFDPEAEALVVAIARDFSPDLVHVHHWRRLSSALVRRLRQAGLPVVLTLHDQSASCARSFRVRDESHCERPPVPASCRDCVDRFWYQTDPEIDARVDLWREEMLAELDAASRILCPSKSLALELVARLGEDRPELASRLDIAPLPAIAEASAGAPRGDPVRIAYWGALQALKGPHLLLQALARLERRNWELDLWGDPAGAEPLYRERLADLARDLPVNRRGVFRSAEIPASYQLAVFPSIALESHSFAVDEAFLRGIPVLVPDRGAPAERIGGGGLTFRAEDERDLARKLESLIGEPERLARLAAGIPRLLPMQRHVAALLGVYAEACAQPGPAAVVDEPARSLFLHHMLEHREGELWRLRGRVDQEADRAEGLLLEVETRDREIRRRDEILAESNANVARLGEQAKELEAARLRTVEERAQLEKELRRELAQRDLDAQKRETVIADFSRSAEGLRLRVAALERERNDLEHRLQVLDEELGAERSRGGEALEARARRIAGLEGQLEAERRLRAEAEAERDRGERAREESAAEAQRLRGELVEANAAAAAERETSRERLAESRAAAEAARQEHEAECAELEARLAELERGRERLRLMAANLREELEGERERLALTSQALDRALAEIEGKDRDLRRLVSCLLDAVSPIARESGISDPERRPAEELVRFLVDNHYRLHELIGQRDGLLAELVLRIDDYERRLAPPEEGGSAPPEGRTAAGFRRRISRLKRRLERRREGDRLRILFVVHDFLPRHNAGTEIYTFNLASELQARHDVHLLFCEARHEQPRYTVAKGVHEGLPYTEVVHNYQWESFEETYHDPRMEAIFQDVLDDFQPDVVHIQHLHYFSIRFIDIAKDRGLPVVYTLHEFMLLCARGGQLLREDMEICELPVPEKCADCIRHQKLAGDYGQREERRARERVADLLPAGLQKAFEGFAGPRRPQVLDAESRAVYARAAAARLDFIRRSAARVDLFISPSAFLRERFIAAGMARPDQIIHSDNGFDVRPFQGVERRPSATLRFGFVGTIAEYKGIHVLVEAMNGIRETGVELQIWGDIETFQDYKARLLPLIDNPAIRLMGRFDNARIAEVLAGIDVLIVPSLWFENSPLTIHEAWLARIPVIASDRGGMAELVADGVGGFHFRLGDADDLREKMRRFVADRGLAARMGARPGPVKTIAENAREIEALYLGLVGSPTR